MASSPTLRSLLHSASEWHLHAFFALWWDARQPTATTLGDGPLKVPCGRIWMIMRLGLWLARSRRNIWLLTGFNGAVFVGSYLPNGTMASTPGAALQRAALQPRAAAAEEEVAELALPELSAIFAADVPTVRHVPRAARGPWAQCLARALHDAAELNSVGAWQRLLLLPKAVLRPPPRGGAARREQAAQHTRRRCQRWLEGEMAALWELGPARQRKRRASDGDEAVARRHARCCSLAAEGELSRACAALVDPQPLEVDDAVLDKLRAKHPPALASMGPPARGLVPDLTADLVAAAVRKIRRGSAPGPSGLRGDHLREALATAHGDEVAVHLANVVGVLAAGDVPVEVAAHLAGGTLFALPKGEGDVRPIAVGETLRRLTGKCLCTAVKDAAHARLAPYQLGVAAPLGAEAAVHTARQWLLRNAGCQGKVLLKVDFENAFNEVDRGEMLRQVRAHLPGLAPFAEWCYGGHSRLLCQGTPFSSEAGVQQGDPLGPLLFALALQPALLAAATGGGRSAQLELTQAFLDDVFLAGDFQQVASGLRRLCAAARQAGLRLNPGKCELIACAGELARVDVSLFPAGIPFNTTGTASLLGAPIGPAVYCEAYTLTKRVDRALPLLRSLAALPDPQTGLLLLQHCASFCKVVFAARVTPPALIAGALEAFDKAVVGCLEELCTGGLSDAARTQASLSTSVGGLGLRNARRHSPAAYVASVVATRATCSSLDPGHLASFELTESALSALNAELPASDKVASTTPPTLKQHTLSLALDRATLSSLQAPGPGKEAFRAHLALLQQPGAGSWLHAPPAEALDLHVEPALFKTMVKLRLRLPVATVDSPCPFCDGIADKYGDHARACPCGGDRTKRHHRLRALVAGRCRAAGLHTEVEKPGLLPPRLDQGGAAEDGLRQGPGRRPADVFVGSWGLSGPAAFDLAVTSGMRSGTLAATASAGGGPAADYEAKKRQHLQTQSLCSSQGIQFVPLVAEACGGGWAPAAQKTWRTLGSTLASCSGEPAAVEIDRLHQALALTLQRENARAVLRRQPPAEVGASRLPAP